MNKESFGNFIKELRQKKKYTQKDLADLLYLDLSSVSKWERGICYPDITLIPKICEALDVDEHELIKSSHDLEYQKIKSEGLKFIRIKNSVFWTMTIMYIIAVVTCLIVNICVNKTLSWFFIVLTSCLTGFAFLPSITRFFKKNKFFWYLITTYISLVLLYLTCSIYTSNYWFMIASVGTLLGYFLICYPIIYHKMILYINEKYETNKKYFLISYAFGLLLLTVLLLITIKFYISMNFLSSLYITLYSFVILIVIGLVRFLPLNRWLRVSFDLFLSIFYLKGLGVVLIKLFGTPDEYEYKVNFNNWHDYTNGNVVCIMMITLLALAILFLIIGLLKKKNTNN